MKCSIVVMAHLYQMIKFVILSMIVKMAWMKEYALIVILNFQCVNIKIKVKVFKNGQEFRVRIQKMGQFF